MKKEIKAKPFLKWAGGKRSLIEELLKLVPSKYNRYHEPFLGGGALYFALKPRKAYLSDMNEDLMNAYIQIKDSKEKVIKHLSKIKHSKEEYYRIREWKPFKQHLKAVRFIYLNRTCWNGLYRVNSKGGFNVPFGKYNNPMICDVENINNVNACLRGVGLNIADFGKALNKAKKDDLIYLDPPYTTSHKDNGFIKYNSKIFSLDDQYRLRDKMTELNSVGCKIIMSNADHKTIRKCYKGFNIKAVKRRSLISGIMSNRRIVTELIIKNF
ncbi:DNA adenine methylase [Candidatus Omnitrophota bacterium]